MSLPPPPPTAYHRWLGWQAPALRRLAAATAAGLAVGLVLATMMAWHLAVLGGWNAGAFTFLLAVWPIILRADGSRTEHLATREDVNRDVARVLLLAASGVSLAAVGFTLGLNRDESGAEGVLSVALATLTVVVSWTIVNTVFTLRYAHLYYRAPAAGIDFGGTTGHRPEYRDFAYLAFTIGMTYQVSDTNLRDPGIRRTVLGHALVSYVFGVVIVATGVNIVAGLFG
jgi:uncharacterized membrane protein